MKIGVPLSVPADEAVELAQHVEDVGVESVWMFDHLIWPVDYSTTYPYSASGRPPVPKDIPTHDVWVFLAAIAATTTRVASSGTTRSPNIMAHTSMYPR